MTSQRQTSGQAGSPAKTSASPESALDSQASAAALPSHFLTLWSSDDLSGSCWKMSLGSSVPTAALTSDGFSMKWSNSGMAFRGECWTLDTLESPSDAVECSLSQVLNPTAPQRFSLSARAASGILRRANRRGKVLPATLQTALEGIGTEQPQNNQVRRLTPTECERLMGWPDGWTISDRWHANRRSDITKSLKTQERSNHLVETLGGGSENLILSFPSRFGSNANVTEGQAQSMAHSAGAPAVLLDSVGGTSEEDDLLPVGLDSHRYRCCGNGVVAPVAEWIGRRIVEVDRRWREEEAK